jgi:hypothetical protein
MVRAFVLLLRGQDLTERRWRVEAAVQGPIRCSALMVARAARARQDALHRSGEWLGSFSYALLSDEWAARTLS